MISNILLLGSGYVARPCLVYLLRDPSNRVTVASRTLAKSQALMRGLKNCTAITLDITNEEAVSEQISNHDLVIR